MTVPDSSNCANPSVGEDKREALNMVNAISVALSITAAFVWLRAATDRPRVADAKAISAPRPAIIVWQPSHQTDTGVNFNEAQVSNGIVEAAMKSQPLPNESKVWSLGVDTVHHSNVGSNTVVAHTTAITDGRVSGYAYELAQANARHPDVFIAVHNNGGSKRHAIWGYVHEGDKNEPANRALAARIIKAIADVTDLENRGVLLDSSTGRNDYRCSATGQLAFFSLDEHVNTAPYRVLLEVGDNEASRDFLLNPAKQKIVGEAIKKALVEWLAETWKE